VEFDNVEKIEPLDFDHQGNMDDWLIKAVRKPRWFNAVSVSLFKFPNSSIIEKIADVVVGTGIPYNYDNSKFK